MIKVNAPDRVRFAARIVAAASLAMSACMAAGQILPRGGL